MSHCAICGRGYRVRLGRNGFCQECQRTIDKDTAEQKRRSNRLSWRHGLWKAVHWKGYIVGFYENGGSNLKVRALAVEVERVPKSLLVDLDTYCPGYDRHQVKKMKKAVAQVYDL